MDKIKTILSKVFFQASKNDIDRATKAIKCNHEKGEFNHYLAQGIRYYNCKNCNEVFEDLFFEELEFKNKTK
tara:strand:+ start:64 stop:279 length:216 start_codon:yes stop_codon:yes gene_type:complete